MEALKIAQDLKISQLRAFVTVVKVGGFHTATERLNKSQPAISLMVKALEANLGQNLFEKNSHAKLTPFGHYFLKYAKQLVVQHDEIKARLEKGLDKDNLSISIATLPSVAQRLLPKYLRGFYNKYPKAHIHLRDASSDDIVKLLKAHKVDVAICTIHDIVGDFTIKQLSQDKMGVVCHRDHPLAKYKSLTWLRIKQYNIIANGTWGLLPSRQFEALMLSSTMNIVNMISLNAALEANLGITVLPELAYSERGALIFLPLKQPTIYRQIGILKSNHKILSPMAKRFFDYLLASY